MANEKILVVDDDTNICELLRLYLTKEGYQVTTANDGEEGLEKFSQVKPGGLPPHPQDGKHPGDDADGQGRDL